MRHFIVALFLLAVTIQAQIAVKAEALHVVSGPMIRNGIVLMNKGKITAVGPAASIKIPVGYKVVSAKVATPGLVDAHSTVGLAGVYNRNQDQEQHEKSEALQPELRALDAYNAREALVTWLREHGVTTVNAGHAPNAVIPGQTVIVKTLFGPTEAALIRETGTILAALGNSARGAGGKSPGTIAKQASILRSGLIAAGEYLKKKAAAKPESPLPRNLRHEALGWVLERKIPLMITAQKDREILTALRIAKEFDLKIILDGAAEAHLVLDQIKAAGVPVVLHPPLARANGDLKNISFETASKLKKAGIPFCFQSAYESYVPKTRVILFEAAIAAANGLEWAEALKGITLSAAQILGIDKRVGSIEVGKDGDIALFDGDPFEYTSHVTGVIINGKQVSTKKR
ncbi:MAG: imidazolonepropionase-like amidohydrolase [Planctomycetota bacterium]|jgi:imidazolonepropionase-like amidohydrolase